MALYGFNGREKQRAQRRKGLNEARLAWMWRRKSIKIGSQFMLT